MMRRVALTALMLAAACNSNGNATGFSTSVTTAPPGASSTSSDTSTSTSISTNSAEDSTAASSAGSSSSSAASSGGIPDVGIIPDGGEPPPPGCKGKVDILFTISGAHTMELKQARLKASFPGFIATLESDFADFDYHILSANTSVLWGYSGCKDCEGMCPEFPDYPCEVTPEPCDLVRGAGVSYPIGKNASNERCDLASGLRYITAGQPNLDDAFTCIASMGTEGAPNVAEVTVMALAEEINAPGGCNAEFLRDDALLVVVAIQDTYDSFSEGTPEDWAAALIDAKGGDKDAVVLLVISTDKDEPDGVCGYTPLPEHELRVWTEIMQPNALFGSICADTYADYFAAAATMIKSQCDVFAPQ